MEPPPFFPQSIPIPPLPNTQALSSITFKRPPLDGSLTLPQIYDWHYQHTTNHPVFVFADDDGSLRKIAWPEVVRAVHIAGKHVLSTFNSRNGSRPIVAILTASDSITYFTLIVGIMRADCIPFCISPRNSAAAVAHLLYRTHAHHVLISTDGALQELASAALAILKKQYADVAPPSTSPVPVFEDLYRDSGEDFEMLPPYKSVLSDTAIILHSSGSTAFPKPISTSHVGMLQWASIPFFGERDLTGKLMSSHAMPMYHAMGMTQTGWAATCGVTIAVFKPQSPAVIPTPESVLQGAMITNSKIIFCVPLFLEAWARHPEMIERLKVTDGLLYGGGPLNKNAGDTLVRHGVNVWTLYGCTELGILTPVVSYGSDMDWDYFRITEQYKTYFIPNGSGQAELVVVPSQFESPAVINGTCEGQPAYYTSDLVTEHASKPGYWKVYGRADDQLIHSSGEKTNPGPLEGIINEDPLVKASVMFGHARFNVGIIVEPLPQHQFDPIDEARVIKFRNAIWPTVQRMNEYAPQHSRLFKEMIIVSLPSKPFAYTAKSTPRRQVIIKAYKDEINALYEMVDAATQPFADLQFSSDWTLPAVLPVVRSLVHKVLQDNTLSDDADIFLHGGDSLQATWIRNMIIRALKEHNEANANTIQSDLVFENPTIVSLANFICQVTQNSQQTSSTNVTEDKIRAMHNAVVRHTQDIPVHAPALEISHNHRRDVVLITGTTGAIGARILHELLQSDDVGRIYAINRHHKGSASLLERQTAMFQTQGLSSKGLQSRKLVLIETDLDGDALGLGPELLEEIRCCVTHIIHNAWRVDFNLSLASFEPNIRGVRQVIDLALSSQLPTPARILFVSSIAVAQGARSEESIPEQILDAELALSSGYSQSKWVSEVILSTATRLRALHTSVVRVGQVSGDAEGYWNTKEWFPAMVKTSAALGCFPKSNAYISWIPLHKAARFLAEARNAPSPILHLVHPNPASWDVLATAISSELRLRSCSYAEWLGLLEAAAKKDGVHEYLPAVKIISFFQNAHWAGKEAMGLPMLDTKLSREFALDNAKLVPIAAEDAQAWVRGWRQQGFLPDA